MSIGSVVTNNLPELPVCNFCEEAARRTAVPESGELPTVRRANYDGKTTFGPWAYMCDEHFRQFGVGLGTGRGQLLIASNPTKES
jgi:hypothetical protein